MWWWDSVVCAPSPLIEAKNTVVGHVNLCQAIKASHGLRPCVFQHHQEKAVLSISVSIRMLLAKYREVYKDLRKGYIIQNKAGLTSRAKCSTALYD